MNANAVPRGNQWRALIAKSVNDVIALRKSRRELRVDYELLIRAIVAELEIEVKRSSKPYVDEITAYRQRISDLVATADRLKAAIESAGAKPGLRDVKPSDIIDPTTGEATRRHSAEIDLLLVCIRAMDGLRKWNRLYRPPKARPRNSVALITYLRDLCCRQAGFSAKDFENLLHLLNDSPEWVRAGFPKLATSTLIQREYRHKKKTGTKTK